MRESQRRLQFILFASAPPVPVSLISGNARIVAFSPPFSATAWGSSILAPSDGPIGVIYDKVRTAVERNAGHAEIGNRRRRTAFCTLGVPIMKLARDKFLPFRHSGSKPHRGLDPQLYETETWEQIPHLFRALVAPLPPRWEEVFGPLRAGKIDDLMVVGQIGQSLDGRVATTTGRSHYINCPAALEHLHRLRALVDAVVVGVETACRDDPQLTVRRVSGPNPVRVVVDPRRRLPQSARLCNEQGRTIVVSTGSSAFRMLGVETISLPAVDGQFSPADILVALAELGLRRVLVEGGANTLSRFMQTGCLDRLHVMVAPLILGAGRPSFAFGAVDRIEEALHPSAHVHRLGNDILFDCDLSAQRVPVWRASAKKSM